MKQFVFQACNSADTDRLAETLAASLPSRLVIGLTGTLGAGKTYLVRQVASHLGVHPSAVVSPTFTLCNEYHGSRSIYHLDVYRVDSEDALFELGAFEYFEMEGLCFIEWADRFEACLPINRLMIDLDWISESERKITLTAHEGEGLDTLDLVVGRMRERA